MITLVAEPRHETQFPGINARACVADELSALANVCAAASATTPLRGGDFGTIDPPDVTSGIAYGVHLQEVAGKYEASLEFVPPYTDDYLVSLGTPLVPVRVTTGGHDAPVTCGQLLPVEERTAITGSACDPIRAAFRVHLLGGQKARIELGREPASLNHRWVRVVVANTGVDSDGDGVADPYDVCPNDATATIDEDGDGLCGAADACPLDPQNDVDNDGVCGNVDNCPAVSNPGQANQEGDAYGDACDACPTLPGSDADGDGVCDASDNCPGLANSDQRDEDSDGRGDACDGDVGYYDTMQGEGVDAQVEPIFVAGAAPVLVQELSPATLASLGVLFAQNPSNGSFGAEFVNAAPDIATAVQNGLVLVLHDRYVSEAESVLPGGQDFQILRDFADDRNIQITDGTTPVTNGPGGVITDSSLDNGTSSTHGFAVAGSLPGDSRKILSRTLPGEVVTFCYAYGAGAVIYSSIPLDYYLAGSGTASLNANMQAYAANVVAWAVAGACRQR